MNWLKKLFVKEPPPTRLDKRLVSYKNANAYLERGYTIAPEEDYNRCIGFVWLEKHVSASPVTNSSTEESK